MKWCRYKNLMGLDHFTFLLLKMCSVMLLNLNILLFYFNFRSAEQDPFPEAIWITSLNRAKCFLFKISIANIIYFYWECWTRSFRKAIQNKMWFFFQISIANILKISYICNRNFKKKTFCSVSSGQDLVQHYQ